MKIEITVPAMLKHCTGEQRHVWLEASRLDELIEKLKQAYPLLVPHVWEPDGHVRKHIMVFYNEQSVGWLDSMAIDLKEGDRLQVVQAVSGG
jgi:molybdopterin converting factor small subunit